MATATRLGAYASRLSFATVAAVLALTSFGSAQSSATNHELLLTPQSADRLADGTIVVTSVATGDLAGVVTLQLKPAGAGAWDGEWAFTVASVDNTNPETGEEPPAHAEGTADGDGGHEDGEAPHQDFVRLIHRGSLSGSITAAQVTFDADGVADVLAPLSITQGASEFAGATGTGQATLSALTLSF